MEFTYSDKVKALEDKLGAFMDQHIYPNEERYEREVESGDRWQPVALMEELKGMPWGAVWDAYCEKHGVPVGTEWLAETKRYEKAVLSKRAC